MTTRTYRQTRRADATERTRAAILAAARRAVPRRPGARSLAGGDRRARRGQHPHRDPPVRLQGGADGGGDRGRGRGRGGDPPRRARRRRRRGPAIVAHYEAMGDEVMRWLALAERLPFVRRVTERGTETHLDVGRGGLRARPRGAAARRRRARRAALATATDVYVWHLLRRREGLGTRGDRAARCWALVEAAADRDGRVRDAASGRVKVLAYTSPARGHLTPMMGPLLELRRRGAEVHVRTLAAGVDNVRAAGIEAEPIAAAIEAIAHDDHEARVQITSGARSFTHPAAPGQARGPRLRSGARGGLPRPRPRRLDHLRRQGGGRARGPALGGLPALASGRTGRRRDARSGSGCGRWAGRSGGSATAALGLLADGFDQPLRLPAVNAGRRAAGLPPLRRAAEFRHRAPLTLYFTASPLDYPRRLPPSVVMIGPSLWDPTRRRVGRAAAGESALGAGRLLLGVPGRRRDRRRRAGRAARPLPPRHHHRGGRPGEPRRSRRRARRALPPPRRRSCREADVASATAAWGSPRRRWPSASRSASSPGDGTSSTSPPTSSPAAPGPESAAAACPPRVSPPRSRKRCVPRRRREGQGRIRGDRRRGHGRGPSRSPGRLTVGARDEEGTTAISAATPAGCGRRRDGRVVRKRAQDRPGRSLRCSKLAPCRSKEPRKVPDSRPGPSGVRNPSHARIKNSADS